MLKFIQIKSLGLIILAFVLYYLAAQLGLEVATINKQTSPVWPATGIAMSLIYLFGFRTVVGIYFASLLINYGTGLSLLTAAAIALGNSLESLFFVWVFSRLTLRESSYGMHSKAILAIFATVVATGISATIGSATLWLASFVQTQALINNWTTWWIGDLLGALFLVPIAFKLKSAEFNAFKINQYQLIKLLVVLLVTISVSYFIFATDSGRPYLFIIFIPLLLAANWLNSIWLYLISLAICSFSVGQTVGGYGPFSNNLLNDSLIHLQIFLAGFGITAIGLGSLRQEGLHFRSNFALIFGWTLSGMAFYFSFASTSAKDETNFLSKISQSKEAIEARMDHYIRVLESGVSFFNASESVSEKEWRIFSNQILSTSRYPGIEGIGVIFSSTIKDRFLRNEYQVQNYQPKIQIHDVPNLPEESRVEQPEDKFIITYIEPRETNFAAIGLNISSEKHRYGAALKARNSGEPAITQIINLVQDEKSRPGFLIYVPIYKNGSRLNTIKDRKAAFIGFIYAPVIFEKFIDSAMKVFERDVSVVVPSFKMGQQELSGTSPSQLFKKSKFVVKDKINLAGEEFEIVWKKGDEFESSLSFVASFTGFFGAIMSLFLAVMLSSLQNLTARAQKIASEIDKRG